MGSRNMKTLCYQKIESLLKPTIDDSFVNNLYNGIDDWAFKKYHFECK